MNTETDAELLHNYCGGSRESLDALFHRHVNLVHAVAVRCTGDSTLADDVTQAVFIVLTRNARSLRSRETVAGWLIVVTRHVARTAIRARDRRRRHERAAARLGAALHDERETLHGELAPVLDDALASLRRKDRDAIALRYLQSHTLFEVGQILGISEEAARKRVARAIERLRESFDRRGITLNSAVLSSSLAAFAAPPEPSRVSQTMPVSELAQSLSNGELNMLRTKKSALIGALIALAICCVAGLSVLAQVAPTAPSAAAAPALADKKPNDPAISAVALQLAVSDVEANVAFFEKMGFHQRYADAPDAEGKRTFVTVDSGAVRIRLKLADRPPHPIDSMVAYLWVDGGLPAITALRASIADQGIRVSPLGYGGSLRQFEVVTPDGYTIGFYTSS